MAQRLAAIDARAAPAVTEVNKLLQAEQPKPKPKAKPKPKRRKSKH